MKWLATIVLIYMLAALCWWTILLLNQNDLIYLLNNDLVNSVSAEEAIKFRDKQRTMIIGEGLVFGLSLLIGIYLIYRIYKKEIFISKSQNNFLLAFSHELKSPLTSINLSLDTIKKRKLEDEMKADICDSALNESKRLESLINSILLVAKIDNFEMHQEDLDLEQILRDIIANMDKIGVSNNRINLKIEGQDFRFTGDKIAIQSIFINLIENALKYGNNDIVDIRLYKENDNIVYTVADRGEGIPESERLKIFDRFYRVGEESKRTSKGTGLGLYIVKKLVEAHQGKISVKPNVDKGSLFKVILQNPNK